MVLSSAIVCDHDRRIADDRRSVFPYDRRRSQNILRSAIVCDHMETSLNIVGRSGTLLRHVGCNWLKFDHFQTRANNTQHVAIHRNTVAKRTQHIAPNNLTICCVEMLPSFGRGLRWLSELCIFSFCKIPLQLDICQLLRIQVLFSSQLYGSCRVCDTVRARCQVTIIRTVLKNDSFVIC